ncbi:MAG: carboxypeptidase regulatory-like domain-containing protein, partial [Planctomycetes bacterium]|nr:carboxypeptidase regulatory-like domain-containing protein [Planctomycetota bacterium]
MLRLRAALLFVACIWLAASAGTQQPPQVHRNLRGTVRGPGTDRTRVTVWHNDMNKHAIEPIAEGFANADGTFAFDRVPWFARQQWGSQSVVVVARRNGQAGLVTLRSDEARTDQIDVTVAATIELGGRVHGADGKPLAGARVWPAVFGDSPNHQPKAWVTEPLLPWIAETGADGAFTLRGLPPLPPFQLRVEHPDHAKAWVDAGDGTEWVLAELQPGARIRGHVRLPDGTPAPRVRVAAAATGAGFGHTLSDEHGAFILTGLPAGRYKVWAEAPDLTVVAAAGIEATAGNVASD